MSSAQALLGDLTDGPKDKEKMELAEELVSDLKLWSNHTTKRMGEMKHKIQEDDANWLMKLLVERQKLPMATQLAVLRRKDVAELTWTKRLLANHTASPSLADQLRAIIGKEA